MKIICFIDTLGPGGAQRQITGLSVQLKEKGNDVQIITYHDNPFYAEFLSKVGVPYVFLSKAERAISRFSVISKYLRRNKPDVVIAYLETPSILACMAKMLNHSFKLIVSERNTTQVISRNEKLRFKLFEIADFVVPNSFSQERFIKEHYPKLASKVSTITNFVDLDYFVPIVHSRRSVPEIVIAASIWPPKNTMNFIKSVALLKQRGVSFHVSWYGITQLHYGYYEECQRAIVAEDVADYISLLDKTKEIKAKYQESDYFCLPSLYEGTPNVICEALACGLPVVCSDVCDNSKYVQEGVNGKLFNPHSVENMADAIEGLLRQSDEDYLAYREASRRIAEEKLSKTRFVNQYIELLKRK